jgi:hypothetical protein
MVPRARSVDHARGGHHAAALVRGSSFSLSRRVYACGGRTNRGRRNAALVAIGVRMVSGDCDRRVGVGCRRPRSGPSEQDRLVQVRGHRRFRHRRPTVVRGGCTMAALRARFPFEMVITTGDNIIGDQDDPSDLAEKFDAPSGRFSTQASGSSARSRRTHAQATRSITCRSGALARPAERFRRARYAQLVV